MLYDITRNLSLGIGIEICFIYKIIAKYSFQFKLICTNIHNIVLYFYRAIRPR